ncbi:MAG: DUF620 domain-containing protein [Bacteroidales bacterium]|nr:DUF620 domain-containing protein [Bacteroidales bacterium]
MKNLLSLLFATFIMISGLQAQDLNEILNTYFETIGQENFVEHKTMIAKGKSIGQGMENDFTIWQKRPDSFKLEVTIQGAKLTQVFDGKIGWYIAPWTGSPDPVEITGFQLSSMEKQADFDGMLYNYKEKGYETELIGTEEMEGTDIFKIKQLDQEGNEYFHYIDSDNFVLLKTTSKLKVDDSEIEIETLYSNYKEQDGIIIAFSMESRQNGQTVRQINMEEIIFDEEIDDSMFVMPEKQETQEEGGEEEDVDVDVEKEEKEE